MYNRIYVNAHNVASKHVFITICGGHTDVARYNRNPPRTYLTYVYNTINYLFIHLIWIIIKTKVSLVLSIGGWSNYYNSFVKFIHFLSRTNALPVPIAYIICTIICQCLNITGWSCV